MRSALPLALLLTAVTASTALAAFGRDPYTPVVLSPVAFNTMFGSAASDGSGGMLVAWTAGGDIYVQRLTSSGAVASGWPVNGLIVCNATGSQTDAALLGDGAGGAIVAWTDARGANLDIYATRVLGNATIAPGWPVNGVKLSTNDSSPVKDDVTPQLTSDGAGGAFAIWTLHYGAGDDDIYGAHVNPSGTLLWASILYGPLGLQNQPALIADGSGGFFAGFQDNENTFGVDRSKVYRFSSLGFAQWGPKAAGSGATQEDPFDFASDGAGGVYTVATDNFGGGIYGIGGNHYLANGSIDPGWSTWKTIAPDYSASQGLGAAIPDGAGFLLTAFEDMQYGTPDLFVQRTGPFGIPYAGWPAGGAALGAEPVNQFPSSMVSDGAGGAVVVFLDDRFNTDYLLYASRVLGNGAVAPGWASGGNPIELSGLVSISGSVVPQVVTDGNGGGLIAWSDSRGTSASGYAGVFAQNIDRFGQLGDARPFITRIADVPNDQGGEVSLQWTASYLDANPSRTVVQYSIWRRVPGGTASLPSVAAAAAANRPALRTSIEQGQVVYWEYVKTEPARMLPGYSVVVPTTSDSIPNGNPRTSLMVMAESSGATMFWSSPADSGYSVDNIPPYAPAPFAGTYTSGSTAMHWRPDDVPDLAGYRLYRGTSASFVPGPSSFIASTSDTAYTDAPGGPYYYRLTAVDVHGNESSSTLLTPNGALDVNDGLPRELAFAAPQPNPAHARTRFQFALPRETSVRLAIFDLGGRRVRVLDNGMETAGTHTATWDLRDDAGHAVNAGLYFARFEAEGRSFTRRVVAAR